MARKAVAQTDLVQEKVRTDKFQLFAERHQCLVLALQHVTVNTGQVLGEVYRILGVILNFSYKRVEAVEQKMRIELVLQGGVACRVVFGLQYSRPLLQPQRVRG